MADGVSRQNDDGTWSEAIPLDFFPGPDFEVYDDGHWEMYEGQDLIASGAAKSRIGATVQMWQAKRKYLKEKNLG